MGPKKEKKNAGKEQFASVSDKELEYAAGRSR